jgi:PKHD-type hydroxylase
VTPVTKGTRWASFFWLQSMVCDGEKRELLYDLDQSIQALTLSAKNGDENLSRLTGVYHNLIRQWAVV